MFLEFFLNRERFRFDGKFRKKFAIELVSTPISGLVLLSTIKGTVASRTGLQFIPVSSFVASFIFASTGNVHRNDFLFELFCVMFLSLRRSVLVTVDPA
jgi:hypothetical protein